MTDQEAIAILADVLLPGDAATSWPSASKVVSIASWIAISPEPQVVRGLAARVAACPVSDQMGLVAAFEASEPATFAALYGALSDLYYTSPVSVALVAEMAAAGPHDPEPFDPSRLAGVIARQAGRRRL
jgi:hypothetical protein